MLATKEHILESQERTSRVDLPDIIVLFWATFSKSWREYWYAEGAEVHLLVATNENPLFEPSV